MTTEHWHRNFDPAAFLRHVNVAQLVARNEAYNESLTDRGATPCILCSGAPTRGIILNDRSFLCGQCYERVALISYPERYEALHRQHLAAAESRRLAWESLRSKHECREASSPLVGIGWASALLMLVNPAFVVLTGLLLAIGYTKEAANKQNVSAWLAMKAQWERLNPQPGAPHLRHFHDPLAELSARDRQVLRVFNHWPGYPPFWNYLREVVLQRDNRRCQVTGCPSRLELHIHHMQPVSEGGAHTPANLVALCDFHHALEPEKGHERIWGSIKTRYFTLVADHVRSNRAGRGSHKVSAHLRRLQLITLDELKALTATYGYVCPSCGDSHLQFHLDNPRNEITVTCPTCNERVQGPQQLTEETGPRLAERLRVTRNSGRWKARWDMLASRTDSLWGEWSGSRVARGRSQYRGRLARDASKPDCPVCHAPMRVVTPPAGVKWTAFWGCTQYHNGCRGTRTYRP